MASPSTFHVSLALWVVTQTLLVTTGKRVLPPPEPLDAAGSETGKPLHLRHGSHSFLGTKAPAAFARHTDNTAGDIALLQSQETSLSQQKVEPVSFGSKGNLVEDMPVCAEDAVTTRCRAGTCRCGFGQQCYPKFTMLPNRIDQGVCQIAMPVLFLLSVLLFVVVLSIYVAARTLLQWHSCDDFEAEADLQPPRNLLAPVPGQSSMGESSDSEQEATYDCRVHSPPADSEMQTESKGTPALPQVPADSNALEQGAPAQPPLPELTAEVNTNQEQGTPAQPPVSELTAAVNTNQDISAQPCLPSDSTTVGAKQDHVQPHVLEEAHHSFESTVSTVEGSTWTTTAVTQSEASLQQPATVVASPEVDTEEPPVF